jgi:hypothetical protein
MWRIWRMMVCLHLEPIENSDSFIAAVDGDEDGYISFKALLNNGKPVRELYGESLLNSFV